MTASVGRIVHLVADDGACLAAIVTKVPDDLPEGGEILLTVFAPSGPTIFSAHQMAAAAGAVSTWHWPERVE